MKRNFFKAGLLIVVMSLTVISCKEDNVITETTSFSDTEAKEVLAIEQKTEVTNAIVEELIMSEEFNASAGRSSSAIEMPTLPACLTITRVLTATTKTVTFDFGTTGCPMPSGHVLKGKVIVSYERNPVAGERSIEQSFDAFYIDDVNIAGSKSIVRLRTNTAGNPQSTITTAITLTWPSGDTASRNSIRVREWIVGVGSGTWGDNVYLITGNASTTLRNGNTHTSTITTALRRELSCHFMVSGTVELTRNSRSATLDFGSGDCDNEATLTLDTGTVHIITL